MKENGYTSQRMHELLDADGNGSVDPKEFIEGISRMGIPQLSTKDLVMIFEAIDTDNNKYLSLNEFSLYLEGAQKKRD